jgi:hypothetical protein
VRLPIFFCHVSITVRQASSAATLSQQEKNNTADIQQKRVTITGFM